MDSSITLGPVLIPGVVVGALGAIVVAYSVLFLLRHRLSRKPQTVIDTIGTAALLAFLVWKLWPLFPWWNEIISEPMILLRMPGGRGGTIAGAAVALIYGIFKIIKDRGLFLPAVVALLSGGTAFLFTLAVLDVATDNTVGVPALADGGTTIPVFSGSTGPGEIPLIASSKPTVITFWATWCGPCRAELPAKKRFYREHIDTVHFVAVNMIRTEPSEGEVRQYIKDHDIPYPVVLDRSGALSAQFQIRGTPTTVVLLPSGEVAARWTGPSSLGRLERSVAAAADSIKSAVSMK